MNKVSAYFSHSIRGKKGADATEEDMRRNCEAAVGVATWIREKVPEIKLYVPAEHEDFVYITYVDKYLTEKQILEVDCKILALQDFHIVHEVDGWLGGGIGVEIDAAQKCNKPIFYLSELDETTAVLLRQMVKDVIEMKEEAGDRIESKGFFYFAHPYTCKDQTTGKDEIIKFVPEGEQANFELCNQRTARLIELGYNIFSPISHSHPIHRASSVFLGRHEHEAWYRLDMEFIAKTQFDGIILAPGWENSKGCRMERDWFVEKGLKVLTYEKALNPRDFKSLEKTDHEGN